ncbi:MAG: hypothetical protein D6706_07380 [Chloroflexi bacterium]|nr:MAG: hypothetical protein D6706_07380 [Chloroflexota bacterium]
MIGLDQTAVVYTANGTTGALDVVDNAALSCRLAHVSAVAADTGGERAELATRPRLLWGTDYTMPNPAEIEVDGERWRVLPESVETIRGIGGVAEYQRAACVRVI